MENNCYLYLHRRLDTNEVFYIGIGSKKYFGRAYTKRNRNKFWRNIVKKAGYVVDIIYKNISKEQAIAYEINLIAMYGRRDLGKGNLVNMTDGGEGITGFRWTEEMKVLASITRKGRVVSEETREKMRNRIWSQESRDKLSNSQKGKKRSLEHIEKMRINGRNQIQSSKAIYKRTRHLCKKVIDTETGVIYNSILEASVTLNIPDNKLRRSLNGKAKRNIITNLKFYTNKNHEKSSNQK